MQQSPLNRAMSAPGLLILNRLSVGARSALTAVLCLALLGWSASREFERGLSAGAVAIYVLVGVLAVYLVTLSYRQSRRSLDSLHGATEAMRQGDLGTQISVVGQDDLSRISRTLETVKESFSALVANIRSDAIVVSHAGKSLAAGASDLASRTERQAATLQQTSAGVQELSETVQRNAKDAVAVEAMSTRVRDIADAGGKRMTDAVDAVRAIKDSSSRVHDIIGVIEGIAFQTNILALNAAVEAARAGDQGRGFAVVASEVRSLALRCTQAAQEVKGLVATSTSKVDAGVKHIDGVSGLLGDIVSGVSELSTNLASITSATVQQSAALVEMTAAIRGLDEITQQNAQMVERASAESAELGQRADRLAQSVNGFRLRQGTADEAFALVSAARRVYEQRGQASLAEITDASSGFVDRDMYVFAWDRTLTYHAFAGKPANVGKSAAQILGTDVSILTRDVWAAAAAGGGWVDYDFLNPVTGQVLPKTSYVVGVSDKLVLGCGVYKSGR
ncbi:hypothetical protein BH10PSE17_BH10PSE17_09940 [soil metagenome]